MKKFEMSWESFPKRYRDSPFFKTDFDSFDRDDDNKQNNNSTQSTEAICDMEGKWSSKCYLFRIISKAVAEKNSFHFMQVFIEINKRSYLHS